MGFRTEKPARIRSRRAGLDPRSAILLVLVVALVLVVLLVLPVLVVLLVLVVALILVVHFLHLLVFYKDSFPHMWETIQDFI